MYPRSSRRPFAGRAASILAGLAASLALVPPGGAEEPPVFAIRGARILPVSSPPIERGTIVVRDGLIEAVGAEVSIPADARVIEGAGLVVTPGLIDAGSDIGLPAAPTAPPAAGGVTRGQRPAAPAAETPAAETATNLNAFVRVTDVLTDPGTRGDAARQAGFTTVLVTPARGIFAGQSALVNLNGDRSTMVVRSPVALHLRLSSSGGFRQYPGSLMGVIAYIRQIFLDARRYGEAWQVYRDNVRALRRPATDRALEALQPAARKELPVVIPASSAPEISRALRIAEENQVRAILSGGTEAASAASALKASGIPVLLSVRYPERPRETNPDGPEESLRSLRRRVEAPRNASALHQAGVPFAFLSDGLAPRDFLANIRRAVRAGLPADAALRSLTLTAAELLGAQEQLGSLEKGKIANLVVADGDLFAERTRLRHVFVDGQKYDVLAEEARPVGAAAVTLTGRWTGTIDAPTGKAQVVFEFQQQGTELRGSATSAMTTAPLMSGSVTGREVRFRAQLRIGEQDFTLTFTGTVEGDTLKGKTTIMEREVDFSVTRAPGGTP